MARSSLKICAQSSVQELTQCAVSTHGADRITAMIITAVGYTTKNRLNSSYVQPNIQMSELQHLWPLLYLTLHVI